jgi:PTS system nitrogen regulatory IIA component
MKLRDLLTVERVIPSLKAASKRDALHKILRHVLPKSRERADAIRAAVMDCAELPAFGPAHGVALPHAVVAELTMPIAAFARLQPALDFGSADGSAIDLVVLLVSPSEQPSSHLRALASIARRLRDPNVRHLLRGSESREAMYMILCGSDWKRSEPDVTASDIAEKARAAYGRRA